MQYARDEARRAERGGGSLLKGQELASTFSFLRPNDLVWNYVVGNYLKGETPPPFDLLYWNSDSTNLPGPMYGWYLRNTYLENNLVKPGKADGVRREGRPGSDRRAGLHLRLARRPHRAVAGAYAARRCSKGKKRFVLGASGHIAGVINPPAKNKRSHWIGNDEACRRTPEAWLAEATEHPGSWWTDWSAWLEGHAAASRSPRPRRRATASTRRSSRRPAATSRQKAADAARPARAPFDHRFIDRRTP